jgi:hypothetical protein
MQRNRGLQWNTYVTAQHTVHGQNALALRGVAAARGVCVSPIISVTSLTSSTAIHGAWNKNRCNQQHQTSASQGTRFFILSTPADSVYTNLLCYSVNVSSEEAVSGVASGFDNTPVWLISDCKSATIATPSVKVASAVSSAVACKAVSDRSRISTTV